VLDSNKPERKMEIYRKNGRFIIFLAILVAFCWEIEGATVTCDLDYGFLPCTSGIWGTLFLIVVYQYLMSIGQSFISNGSDKFFSLIGPGLFGASLFHILANFPTLYIVLESRLSSSDTGASSSAAMGMSVLAGSAIMSLTLIWPSVIVFGSYDLADDDDTILPQPSDEEEPSFLTKLTAYGLTTDIETSYTARLMLMSMIPFLILQLPKIINSASVTRVIVLIALIISLGFFIAYIVYQIFQPWIQNRRFDYVRQQFVKNKLLKLLSTNGKANVQLIKDLYKELDKNHDGKVTSAELRTLLLGIQVQADGELSQDLVDRIVDQLDLSGDESIQEDEFVKVITNWLQEARKSLSKNDYNPLIYHIRLNLFYLGRIYEGLDANHDGKVSNAELKTLILGIQLQADGKISDDMVQNVMDQLDISSDEFIQENEFVRILTKWVNESRKSPSQNDYSPLSFFIKPNNNTNTFLEALLLVFLGTVVTFIVATPLKTNVVNFAYDANVPSFLIPYFVIPCALNISRFASTISSARQKTERAASLTLSQVYSGVAMSSMSSLITFLSIVYIRDLPWDVSAQVLVVLIICGVMAVFTSTRTVYPLWTGYVIYLLYPISLLMLYLLVNVCGW
ncbi:hypothetical protein R6Q57_013614, partial [Mikania cordata]